uniref:RHH-type transcriptional regulator, rel operon repressor / antitoxin RelB n=1 Tax=Candidatus Kentrum sp. FW TaxID=2126338 RepID=A0A450TR07_9GAMM|nr:MAG: hypothetical protein BECKFW1821C_GA0114237_10245 [Candidatus Kentron sp. FW]
MFRKLLAQVIVALVGYRKEEVVEMLTIDFSDELQRKVTNFAVQAGQTPEQAVLEIIEERMDHQSAYAETAYLMKHEKNKERLDQAVRDIRNGIFEEKELKND